MQPIDSSIVARIIRAEKATKATKADSINASKPSDDASIPKKASTSSNNGKGEKRPSREVVYAVYRKREYLLTAHSSEQDLAIVINLPQTGTYLVDSGLPDCPFYSFRENLLDMSLLELQEEVSRHPHYHSKNFRKIRFMMHIPGRILFVDDISKDDKEAFEEFKVDMRPFLVDDPLFTIEYI